MGNRQLEVKCTMILTILTINPRDGRKGRKQKQQMAAVSSTVGQPDLPEDGGEGTGAISNPVTGNTLG